MLGQICRAAVHDRDGGVLFEKHQRLGLAHDVGAADHDGMLAGGIAPRFLKKLHDAVGRTRTKTSATREERAGGDDMEAVDVLFGRDGGDDEFGGEVLRKRKLHEDAVHGVVMVQSVDDGEEFGFGRFGPRP